MYQLCDLVFQRALSHTSFMVFMNN